MLVFQTSNYPSLFNTKWQRFVTAVPFLFEFYILLIVTNQLLAVFYQKLSSIVFRSLCITIRSLCVIIRSLIKFSIFSRSNRCK